MANETQFKLTTIFVATRGVQEYRQTIPAIVRPDDTILEIGCEWGTTSNLIWQVCQNLIATDISTECLDVARSKYPHVHFEQLDAFNIKQAMQFGLRFSKIYIDLSGFSSYRALLDVISLLNMYATVFEPDMIVIKSGSLKQFARHCIVWGSNTARERLARGGSGHS
jgi:hypothetical protein